MFDDTVQSDTVDLFVTSSIRWIRVNPQRIIRAMEHFLTISHPGHRIVWRSDGVEDFRGLLVSACAERLIRWDTRHPNDIFNRGFVPRVDMMPDFPLDSYCVDLVRYAVGSVKTIFVGAVPYRRQNGRNIRWTPRVLKNRFEYEIFSSGGIDVNLSLGTSLRYSGQMEIAFPGGIRPEFIRSAREYDEQGRAVRVWANGGCNLTSNGKSHSVHLGQLPLPLSGRSLEVVYFGNEPADQQDGPGTSCQPHQDNDGDGNPMKEDGQSEEDRDDALDGQCPVLPNRAIFISGDDAPTVGCEYAISIFGTSKVLTCLTNETVGLHTWKGLTTQRFLCTERDGFMGFKYAFTGNSWKYIGRNSGQYLACFADRQEKWENIFARANPAGGFTLWISDSDKLASVNRLNLTEFRIMTSQSTSAIRFGFTRLHRLAAPVSPSPGLWGVRPDGTGSPEEGRVYVIVLYGTSKALTYVDTKIQLHDWTDLKAQRFLCCRTNGHTGFLYDKANGSRVSYLGYDSGGVLHCREEWHGLWENFFPRAVSGVSGGFELWMEKDGRLRSAAQEGITMRLMDTTSTLVFFKEIEK